MCSCDYITEAPFLFSFAVMVATLVEAEHGQAAVPGLPSSGASLGEGTCGLIPYPVILKLTFRS